MERHIFLKVMIILLGFRNTINSAPNITYILNFSDAELEYIENVQLDYCWYQSNCRYSNKILKAVTNDTYEVTCEDCSCDLSTCTKPFQSANCCPEFLNSLVNHMETESCINPSMQSQTSLWTELENAIVMIDRCDKTETVDSETLDKCENTRKYTEMSKHRPVSFIIAGEVVTYKNIYCANCNQIKADEYALKWVPRFKCYNREYMTTLDPLHILNLGIRDYNCGIDFLPPSEVNATDLKSCGGYVSECNKSGLWATYDPLVERACRTYRTVFVEQFRNIFCYACNFEHDIQIYLDFVANKNKLPMASFSMVLDFLPTSRQLRLPQTEHEKVLMNCDDGWIYDPFQLECLEVKCQLFYTYEAGECRRFVSKMSDGGEYRVFIKITFHKPTEVTQHLEYMIARFIEDLIENDLFIDYLKIFKPIRQSSDENVKENYIVAFLVLLIGRKYEGKPLVHFDISILERLIAHHNTNFTLIDSYGVNFTFTFELDTENAMEVIGHNPYELNNSTGDVLLPVLFCPGVVLNTFFYDFDFHFSGVTLQKLDVTLKKNEYMESDQNLSIIVCNDTFERLKEQYHTELIVSMPETIQGAKITPQGILSLICSSCSILCSVTTTFVYIKTNSLRTQPGINNISLIISLILAQTFFQFGTDEAKTIPSWACSLIGGLIHYFWLLTILWMNICTIHMFRVFGSLNVLRNTQPLLGTTCRYWAYGLFVASVPVLINLIVSLTVDGSTGYGGKMCYITESKMVGYCFALPVAIAILANLVFFFVTVYSLSKRPTFHEGKKEEKSFLIVYAKMSTLTGLTWIFGFGYSLSGFFVLEYLFIIFNAGQGIFLFLSFVCNKRVYTSFNQSVSKPTKTSD